MSIASLQQFIAQSSLPPEKKTLWEDILNIISEEQADMFAEFVEDDEDRLGFLTENIEKKKEAFESGEMEHLDEILQDERKALLSVTEDNNGS